MYRIYPTLLDKYTQVLSANDTWEMFWGNSGNQSKAPEQFEKEQIISLIDSVNRVPFDSEPADKGTCFNELIDCLILGDKKSSIIDIERQDNIYYVTMKDNHREFAYHVDICRKLLERYHGASSQVLVEAPMFVGGEEVILYGYIDELMPDDIHDIKTTTKWEFGKFRHHAQHLVYPYCVKALGGTATNFHYDVVQWGKNPGQEEFNVETYLYTEESEIKLRNMVSGFISFLNQYRPLITDKRVFGGVNDPAHVELALEKWLYAPSEEARILYQELLNIDLPCR